MKFLPVYIFLILACCIDLQAQLARKYSFTHFTTANGLATNAVNTIVQDNKGFLWLATLSGLQRYDGRKFLTFKKKEGDSTTIPNDNIPTAHFDKENRLWLITGDHKIGLFNTVSHRYLEIPIRWKKNKSIGGKILVESRDRILLFVTDDGFYYYHAGQKAFLPYNEIPLPPKWSLNYFQFDSTSNRFWLTCDSGIAVYNPSSKLLSYRGHNVENDPAIAKLGDLTYTFGGFPFTNGDILVGTWKPNEGGGLQNHFNYKTGEVQAINVGYELKLGYHETVGRLEQRSGRRWLFGQPFLAEFTGGEKPLQGVRNEFVDHQSLKFDKINNLVEDRENNIWICTPNGLFLFNPDAQHFFTYNLLRPDGSGVVDGPVQTVLQLKNGDIWAGCWGVGLYAYDKNLIPINLPVSFKDRQQNMSIWCMIQHSRSGKVWMGNQGGAVMVYDTLTKQLLYLEPEIFNRSTIRQVTEDEQGNLWFGTQGGSIIKWDLAESEGDPTKGYSLMRKTGRVTKLITDSDGMIWCAGLGRGILRINPNTNQVLENLTPSGSNEYRLSGDFPIDVIQYNDSLFLLASGPLDLFNINTKRISRISTAEGLPSDNVQCLIRDQKGIVWIAMNYGLCRMNLEKRLFTFYDGRDGISTDNFSEARIYPLANKNIVLATDHNFIVFDPEKVVSPGVPPDVELIDFKVSNKFLSMDSLKALNVVNLSFDNNTIEFGFSALSYLRPNKFIYSYRLEGVDKEWIAANERTQAIYTYLQPGNYTFMVKAENGDGLQSRNITTMSIRVQPPFWRSWWFYGIIALLIVVVFYWIDRERVRRIMALQQVRTQIAGNLHQDINTTLNNINLLSELAKIKVDKDISKSKEFIDQIHEKSRSMIDAMDDMLWSIQPENDYMYKTLERMTEYAQGLHKTYGIEIEMIVDENVRSLRIDMKSRHELFLIFKEALNNIIKHAQATMVLINIDLHKSKLLLNIQDNGKGFDPHSIVSGKGMGYMQQRAALLNAKLDVQSDKKGTTVMVNVPIV